MRTAFALALCSVACSVTPRNDGLGGSATSGSAADEGTGGAQTQDTGAVAETGGPVDSATSEASTGQSVDDDDASGDDVKFDTPGDDGGPLGPGCSKIDFLFVVDNSGSMADEQAQLIASFPEFFSTIEDTVNANDFHLLVATTDGDMISSSGGGSTVLSCNGDGNCVCGPAPECCPAACELGGAGSTCFGVPCDQAADIEACDLAQGAGRRISPQGSCDFQTAERYMTGADTNLDDAFACASDVGTYGSGNEIPMEVILRATSTDLNEGGGCNDGFLRDDAILVVTFITDEEDDADGFFGSPGDPTTWHADLIANKGGQEEAVAVLGLFGDNDLPDGTCAPLDDGVVGAEPSPRLRQFVDAFGDRGFFGSVCADDYGQFFADAVSVIDTTCDEFEPEG